MTQSPSVRRSGRTTLAAAVILLLAGCHKMNLPFGLRVNFAGDRGAPLAETDLQQRIKLPPGFYITTYATSLGNARMLRFTDNGDLLVSIPREGKVLLLERGAEPAYAAGIRTLLEGAHNPHGLALHDGWLYVAEEDAVFRVRFDAAGRQTSGGREYVVRGLPPDGRHWTRTIGIGPDGRLYVAVGSSCNACIEDDVRRAAISRFNLDGSGEQLYATGLRNAVGFAWQPGSGQLYATDNGRDLLGDDFPPCELNRIVEGGFYGWPFANGDRVADPDFGKGHEARVAASLPPVHSFGPHRAPLGMTFYDGRAFPERYRGAALVALHGSWNSAKKVGYKVVALFFDAAGNISEEDFASGFEVDDEVAGRPVDVAIGPDGAAYVSDDFTGSVYRIGYGTAPAARAPQRGAAAATQGDPLAGLSAADLKAAAARGQQVWEHHPCASCHVPGGTAAASEVRPLAHLSQRYSIDSLASFLKAPQPPMPAFPLTDAERRDLAIFLLDAHR